MVACVLLCGNAHADHLTIVAANDTHSQIVPTSDGLGGMLRIRAVIDSVRAANPQNLLTLHAGDAFQGSVYFTLYRGAVESAMIDSVGFDAIIVGNHEFDNGIESLAKYYGSMKAEKIGTNYDFSDTKLNGMFKPYLIRNYGEKRVAVIGINIEPKGIVSENNVAGLRCLPAIEVADATAKYLKQVQKVDYVIMLSHIGYDANESGLPGDIEIVKASHYIDLVIGGHSHTVVKPGTPMSRVPNADGRMITIGQNGKAGKLLGLYDVDLETGDVRYKHISVDATWDNKASTYKGVEEWLAPYSKGVDSLMNNPVGESVRAMSNKSAGLQNWVSDVSLEIVRKVSGINDIQFAIMNSGGIRVNMPQGIVSEGVLASMLPFDNKYMVLEISGADLLDAFKVMASRGGDCVSREVRVEFDKDANIISAKLNGKQIKSDKKYKIVTIDYLANGGDYMIPLKNAKRLYVDDVKYECHILDYVKSLTLNGKKIDSTEERRMKLKK